MTEKRCRAAYIATDYASTLVGLLLFCLFRWGFSGAVSGFYNSYFEFLCSRGVSATIVLYPLMMLGIYALSGIYIRVTDKSRAEMLLLTLVSVACGALIYFLVALLNDPMPKRRYSYELILAFFAINLGFVYAGRYVVATVIKDRSRRITRRIAVITPDHETDREHVLRAVEGCFGNREIHFMSADAATGEMKEFDRLSRQVRNGATDTIVIAPSSMSAEAMQRLLMPMYRLNIPVYVSPDDRALMTGATVRFQSVEVEPFIDITRSPLPDSVVALKRFSDIIVSAGALAVLSPVILILAVMVRLSGPGPVFYKQERIGYRGKPFRIYKLRTMYPDSEADGPRLSSDNDTRITPPGRILRKYRLDELPNLWNVLRGDMSLVGPRPEREYYIRQIVRTAPYYSLLHQVRPGLTSWGMVKYGYASSVPQMIERLRYDILYIQNLSLTLDLRIIFHTLRTIVRGEGK